ncbi:hypothetical protein ABIE30_000619 [Janthinobacterium lividum]
MQFPKRRSLQKYLYLTKPEWQHAWIHGGEIPITAASSYLSDVREGTMTPDENLIHESTFDLHQLPDFIFGKNPQIRGGVTFKGCTVNGVPIPDFVNARRFHEDGAILSFCDNMDAEIMRRFGKTCCVRILDVHRLKAVIDEQVGLISKMGPCKYTIDHQRNHFLKSSKDSWQQEYRIFWKDTSTRNVTLPPGISEAVTL